jgi:hypothetical protein
MQRTIRTGLFISLSEPNSPVSLYTSRTFAQATKGDRTELSCNVATCRARTRAHTVVTAADVSFLLFDERPRERPQTAATKTPLSRRFTVKERASNLGSSCTLFLPLIFLGLLRANSCARHLRGFSFPGSSQTTVHNRVTRSQPTPQEQAQRKLGFRVCTCKP